MGVVRRESRVESGKSEKGYGKVGNEVVVVQSGFVVRVTMRGIGRVKPLAPSISLVPPGPKTHVRCDLVVAAVLRSIVEGVLSEKDTEGASRKGGKAERGGN